MPVKSFPKEMMQEVVGMSPSERYSDIPLVMIKETITDTGRWTITYEAVIQDLTDGKFYKIWYSRGATEMQDESPFEYDGDEIECVEVEPFQKTVTRYRTVAD